jgi:hypothetical protein
MNSLRMLNISRTAENENSVRKLMKRLAVESPTSNAQAVTKFLEGLRNQVNELEATLKKVPDDTVFLSLFVPKLEIATLAPI